MAFLEYDLEAKPGEKRHDLVSNLGKLYKLSQKPKEGDEVTIIHTLEDLMRRLPARPMVGGAALTRPVCGLGIRVCNRKVRK